MNSRIAGLIIIVLAVIVGSTGYTASRYLDTAIIEDNTVSTGTWEKESENSVPAVVINEVMWMGSSLEPSFGEWIELKNMTDMPINIGNWTIENARQSNQPAYKIPGSKTIPAGGFFLIANHPEKSNNSALSVDPDVTNASISLKDEDNGHLVLKDASGNVIDSVKGDVWPAGITGGLRQSMQRVTPPGDGLDANNWITCTTEGCMSDSFWKTSNTNNYGTPGAANIY